MDSEIIWYTGQNDFKKHSLDLANRKFTTEILDQEFEQNRELDYIIYDCLKDKSEIEVLYSGGMDSEFILYSCMKHKLPVTAITMILRHNDCIINTHDLYYAEKFCRQNNIKQIYFTLYVNEFFNNDEYSEYLTPYSIVEPHVATHFWLIRKLNGFPIVAGDWPWIQTHKTEKVISPWKIDYSSYERFMQDNNIQGIGSMLSYTFEISYKLSEKQMHSNYSSFGNFNNIHLLKKELFPELETRIKSYGWETFPKNIFNPNNYKIQMIKTTGIIKNYIVWNEKYKKLIDSSVYDNDTFV